MISARPLEYIDANHFSIIERMILLQGNAITCYFQLFDGTNRYVPPATTTVSLKFPRALTIAATPANQDVTITCAVADIRDYSVYSATFTSAQIDIIVSGGVKLIISTGGATKTYPVDDFVTKRSNVTGA